MEPYNDNWDYEDEHDAYMRAHPRAQPLDDPVGTFMCTRCSIFFAIRDGHDGEYGGHRRIAQAWHPLDHWLIDGGSNHSVMCDTCINEVAAKRSRLWREINQILEVSK